MEDPVSWGGYVTSPGFWNRTLQNWQPEFLAVASMVLLVIFLRERGSPQSKRVGDPHS
ncbi:DUF6766 family protein [Microbispora bryophytorum]|uniref:Uncharacterized protein n=1 Tax=Microbispora bryophytorum subsp. camponoti TaxID=1677852 RepID=A0ABR8L688_9ACTN|nr:DUF6766 family protein [Microbispora camponoti]MBD3146437.1 hypothetical protein [Microbispora camponoti]